MSPSTAFQSYLQSELVKRCKVNPRYSLRAFAKALQMDPTTLSKMISGRRPVGKRAMMRISEKLGISPSKFLETPKSELEYQRIADDVFVATADWYYHAILELLHVRGFTLTSKRVSSALGISLHEATDALARLKRVGLLVEGADGKLADASSGFTSNTCSATPSAAHKGLQRQILEKAIRAIDETAIEKRSQSSVTMAIDTRMLPKLKEEIKKFRRKLNAMASKAETKNEVYHLSVSLYPVTSLSVDNRENSEEFQ